MRNLLLIASTLVALGLVPGYFFQQPTLSDIRSADDAWASGQYSTALQSYIKILNGPDGGKYLEQIALQTGELYFTEELTPDGRLPLISPNSQYIAYETGGRNATVTRILSTSANHATVAELQGTGVTFSFNGKKLAYLKVKPNDEIIKAQAAVDSAQGQAVIAATATLNRLLAKYSRIVIRELSTQAETELQTGDLLKSTLAFGADNETVFFVGAQESQTSRNDIYAIKAGDSQAQIVTESEGYKTSPVVDPSGKVILFSITTFPPFRPAGPPAQRNQGGNAPQGGQQAPLGGQGGQGGGFGIAPTKFGIANLATHKVIVVDGTAYTLSSDGSAVAYLTKSGQENNLVVHPIGGDPTAVLKTVDRLDAPAFSPDGQRLAYQKMTRDDWEIYVIGRDGKNEVRITREIQHDILPRFISNDLLLGMIGEPRHRRSYLYDLKTNTRLRLFHNNTVRTIAPEYSWMPSADGKRVLIQADRDGDTVSAQRGVYLVNLERRVTKDELLSRLKSNLDSELALQSLGKAIFAPIADEVRQVVAASSTNRIFEYEKTLFDFDSKHISRPGNKKASEYLFNQYKSFGYEPEYQWFEPRGAMDGKSANVVAVLKGTENPEIVYVVGSHYDSVPVGPGADDDTTGTSALLEAARVLRSHPQPATIIFVSFTGEEAGLLGSREFVRRAQLDKMQIAGVLNNDMIGWANDNRLDNTIRYSNDGIRDIQHAAAMQFTNLITYDTRYHRGTDATAFFEVYGDIIGGIGSYPVLGNPHYHQPSDMLEGINYQLITETSKTTVATLMLLASSPSRLKDLKVVSFNGNTADLTWAPAPEKSVTGYLVTLWPANGKPRMTRVAVPKVTLKDVTAGMKVSVRAINRKGLESWDAVRLTLPQSVK